ncbi:putative transcription factor C2H2 family [Helianthus debilis subsp. tardiflorus]
MDQWPDIDQQDSSVPDSLSEKLVFASIIMLILFIFIFILFIWLLPDRHLHHQNRSIQYPNPRNQSTPIVYNNTPLAPSSSGLNRSILKSLPLFVYSTETKTKTKTETNVDVVDCAVCLSEFENGDKCRVLPNCKHCFHIGCIDMWFYNHSTCPLCRAPVEPVQKVPEPVPSAPFIGMASEEDRRERVNVRIDVDANELVTENALRMVLSNRMLPVVSQWSGAGPSCVAVGTESDVELARQES